MPPKLDLKQQISDADTTHASALNFIDGAQRAQKAAADKCSKVLAPASLGASEASTAREIFRSVDEQQDALILAGLDPAAVNQRLLNYAATLAQSAKSRLIDAGNAGGV